MTVSPDAVTTEGTIHYLGGTLCFAMPFAAALVGWKLARNPAWSPARRPILWAAGLVLAAFVVSFAWLGVVSQSGGTFGPGVPAGWPGRFEILAYSAWVMVVARQAIRVPGKPPRAEGV